MLKKIILSLLLIASTIINANAQQSGNRTIRGRVVDAAGAIIIGAEVTAIGANGVIKTTQTNESGEFKFILAPGKYTIRISSLGFALYENTEVNLGANQNVSLDVTLNVSIQETQVTVGEEPPINTNPEANAGAPF